MTISSRFHKHHYSDNDGITKTKGVRFLWKRNEAKKQYELFVSVSYYPMTNVERTKRFMIGSEREVGPISIIEGLKKGIAFKHYVESKIKAGEGFELLHYKRLPNSFDSMTKNVKAPTIQIREVFKLLETKKSRSK